MQLKSFKTLAIGSVLAIFSLNVLAQSAQGRFACDVSDGQKKTRVSRIVGGETTDINRWPWQVGVFPGGSLCGGSLIHKQWVLTAAHCFEKVSSAAQVSVRAGSSGLKEGGQQIAASKVVVHPGYGKGTRENQDDIALIKLQSPVTHPDARIIQLQDKKLEQIFASPGACAYVTGWGRTADGGEVSPTLRQVSIPIVGRSTCDGAYPNRVSDKAVCAGYEGGAKDSCQGDSGGPLVVEGGPTGWTQTGVVSWGEGCARPGAYGVYTRVASYIDWIQQTVNANP